MEVKKPPNVPANRTTFYHVGLQKVAVGRAIGTAREGDRGWVIVEWNDPDVAEGPAETFVLAHNVLEIIV